MDDIFETVHNAQYTAFFDETCMAWTKSPERNRHFLLMQQNYANDLLKARGILFLNEVYDMLGMPRTQVGQIVGWVWTEDCSVGDNFVDFGLFDYYEDEPWEDEDAVPLYFNVVGYVLEYL